VSGILLILQATSETLNDSKFRNILGEWHGVDGSLSYELCQTIDPNPKFHLVDISLDHQK
jgi:hypothetical protein